MAATTANGSAPTITTPSSSPSTSVPIHSEALNKIVSVPLVHAPLAFAYNTIEAHPIFAKPYHFGEDVVAQSLRLAAPITDRFNGQLHFLDAQAVKALDFAESKWSFPFKATPQQVITLPLSVIQAYSDALTKAYEDKVAPGVQVATSKFEEIKSQNAFVQKTADVLSNLQVHLEKVLENVKNTGKADGEKLAGEAKGIVNSIFEELEKVRSFAGSLPADARKRFDPIVETFGQTYTHLNKEVREGSGPILPRLQKVLSYVQEEALPALRKAAVEGKTSAVDGSPAGAAAK